MDSNRPYLPANPHAYKKALIQLSRNDLISEIERLSAKKSVSDTSTHYTIDQMLGWVRDRINELDRLAALRDRISKSDASYIPGEPAAKFSLEGQVSEVVGTYDRKRSKWRFIRRAIGRD